MTTAAIIHMGMRKPIFTSQLIAPFNGVLFYSFVVVCSFIEGLTFVKLLIHPTELVRRNGDASVARNAKRPT